MVIPLNWLVAKVLHYVVISGKLLYFVVQQFLGNIILCDKIKQLWYSITFCSRMLYFMVKYYILQ